MASAFWYLEDGRGFARRYNAMAKMLEYIVSELQHLEGASDFYDYLSEMVPSENDEPNGHGGFIKSATGESVMLNLDLRSFTLENQTFFWKATQKALQKLILAKKEENEGMIFLLTTLLDMKKRINKKEDPMLLNHLTVTIPYEGEKLGPGWSLKQENTL